MSIKVMSQGGQASLGNSVNSSINVNTIANGVNCENAKTTNQTDMDVVNKNNNQSKENNTINKKELDKAVSKLNGFLEDEDAYARLSFYKNSNRVLVTIYDNDDNVIMQIPSEKVLDMVNKLSEQLGVSVDKKA